MKRGRVWRHHVAASAAGAGNMTTRSEAERSASSTRGGCVGRVWSKPPNVVAAQQKSLTGAQSHSTEHQHQAPSTKHEHHAHKHSSSSSSAVLAPSQPHRAQHPSTHAAAAPSTQAPSRSSTQHPAPSTSTSTKRTAAAAAAARFSWGAYAITERFSSRTAYPVSSETTRAATNTNCRTKMTEIPR